MAKICEQFVGRLRDLCEGRGRDGRPDPIPEVSAQFRIQFGLAPLSEDPDERSRQLDEEGVVASANPAWNLMPATGPGRKLEEMFQELKIEYQEACGCAAYARQMDAWGVAGCRENFEEIVKRLRTNAAKYSLWDKWRAAGHALWSGLAFHVNPLDPFPGLVAEALRRAEADELAKAS